MSLYVTSERANFTLQSIIKKAIRKDGEGKLRLTLSQAEKGELFVNSARPETAEGLIKRTVNEDNGVVNIKTGKHGSVVL